MPLEIDLGAISVDTDPYKSVAPPEGGGVSDYGRAFAAGAYGTVGSLAAGLEYLTGADNDSALAATRDWAEEGSTGQVEKMSESGRQAYGAGFLPDAEGADIWDKDVSIAQSLGLKVAGAAPSLIASILPGGIAAGAARSVLSRAGVAAASAARGSVAVGTGTAGLVNTDMMAGQVHEDIQKGIREAKDDYLQENSSIYRYLRQRGRSEDVAKKVLVEYAEGNKPLIAGAVGALAEQFGAGKALSKGVAGLATKGVIKGGVKAGTEEALTEAAQSGFQEGVTQQGNIDAGLQEDFDWRKILNSTVEGATVGGILGGVVGGATSVGGRERTTGQPEPSVEGDTPDSNTIDTAVDVVVDPVADVAAGTPRDNATVAREGLEEVGRLLDQNKQAIEELPAQVTETFVPANEFEADPDAPLPGEAQPQTPATVADVAPGRPEPVQELPTVPPAQEAAVEPSQAITEPSGVEYNLADLPPVPPIETPPVLREPRVLPSTTASEPVKGQKRTQRISRQEAANIAEGKSAAGTMSQDPEVWKTQPDRNSAFKLAKAEIDVAAKAGREPKAWASEMMSLKGKMGGQGTGPAAARERYYAARQALADEQNELIQSGAARRETSEERQQRAVAEKREADSRTIANILKVQPTPDKALRGLPKDVRGYAQLMLDVAAKAGVKVSDTSSDPFMLYLRNAREAANPASSKSVRDQFMTDDFFIRNNAGDELAARRKADALKTDASYDEAAQGKRSDEREGTDASEAYDAGGASEIFTAPEEAPAADPEPVATESVQQDVREVAAPDEDATDPVVRAGQNRAGTFVVQARKSRRAPVPTTRAPQVKEVTRPSNSTVTQANATDAQKEAGNYQKRHIKALGLDVSIENEKGSTRSGKSPNGKEWSVTMPAAYGYIRRTEGADGDHVDVYMGPLAGTFKWQNSGEVFVVNQQDLDGKFDEHKAMLGFRNYDEALKAYKAGFSDRSGAKRVQSVGRFTTSQFRQWLKDGDMKKPAVDPLTSALENQAQAPAARLRSPEDEKALRDFNKLYEDMDTDLTLDFDDDAPGVVTSPRSGVQVRALQTSTLGQLLSRTPLNTAGGLNTLINEFMARRLKKLVPNVPVHIVSKNDMIKLTQDLVDQGGLTSIPLGYYEPSLRSIVLDQSALRDEAAVAHLLVHEGLHAAFLDTINNDFNVSYMISDLMRHVEMVSGKTEADFYGLSNEHEFISEAFSSPKFQNFLRTVRAPNNYQSRFTTPSNIWSVFIAAVRKFLRLSPVEETSLDAVLRIGAVLTHARDAADAPSSLRAMNLSRAERELQNGIRAAMSDRAQDIRTAGGGRLQRVYMRFKTLDQLRQGYGKLFGGAMDRAVKAMQRMQPFVDGERKRGEVFAQKFVELQRTNPKVARESALLRNDLTMANLNVLPGTPTFDALKTANPHLFGTDPNKSDISAAWQSKAQAQALQKRFSALPADVQQQMIAEQKYYKEMQDRISRDLIGNIIEYFGNDYVNANRDAIITRTMAGTLTQDDSEGMNNRTLFNALQNAKELRAQKGFYFPLMRHGNYVVRTRDALGDLGGGVEVEPGVIEFKEGKEKASRAAAKAFAEGLKVKQLRTVRAYYDPVTGERIKADDADASSIVAYRVNVQKEGVHFFDSDREAARFAREAKASGNYAAVSGVQVRKDAYSAQDLSGSQLASLISSARARKDLPEATKDMMMTAIGQAAIRMMSGNRIQSRSLPRKYVAGASSEYARNAMSYASAASGYLGKLRYMPTVREAMTEMRGMVEGEARFGPDADARANVFGELEARVNANEAGINKPSKFVQDLMQVAMLTRLFSPAHSIINATQVGMVSYPVLAGEHGAVTAAVELERAYRSTGAIQATASGVVNSKRALAGWRQTVLDTTDIVKSIRDRLARQDDGENLNAMLDELRSRGALDDGAAFEIGAAIAGGRGPWGTGLAKMDRIFRQAPAAIEAVNRTVTAVAAYRLARRTKGHEQAVQYAYDTTLNTQGDYSSVNAAPFFNNPVARPFLQFKKYGQMMTNLYVDMIVRSFKGASKADRMVARKQFMHLVAVQTLAAGALSIPGMELVKMAAVVSAMLGFGGGFDDIEREIKDLTDNAIGEKWSELVRKGILSRAAGIDLSSRMSLADMWTFGEPRRYTNEGISAWIAQQMLGAPGGVTMDFREALIAATEGNWLKAASKGLPIKFAADTAKAFNGLGQGKLGPIEAAGQIIGIRSARVANRQEQTSREISERQAQQDKRSKLRRQYLEATTEGERIKIRSKIRDYNKTATGMGKLSIKSVEKIRQRENQRNAQ